MSCNQAERAEARRSARLHLFCNVGDDAVEGEFGLPAADASDLGAVRGAVEHVLEARFICLVVGNDLDLRFAMELSDDGLRELADRDAVRAANVQNLAERRLAVGEEPERADRVGHVAETAGLFACAEDAERFALKRGGDETRDDHAVTPGLARADRVEEARDGAGEVFRTVVGHEQELVDELAAGVAPAGMRGGA